jgi:hypothetical protein
MLDMEAPAGPRPRRGHAAISWMLEPRVVAVGKHSQGHYAARSVYGAILVLALLLALQQHPTGPFHAALLVAGTILAVLAAEAYADLLGLEIDRGGPPTREQRRDKIRELAVVTGAAEGPVLVLVLAGFGVIGEARAFRLAVGITIALLFLAGFLARWLAGRSLWASLQSSLVAGGLGVGLAVFKHFVHA